MLPTHALAGMALALPVALLAPEFGGVALAAGFVGGVLPDLDMYVGHRKTLHYPTYFSALALVAIALAAVAQTAATVGLALVLLAAAVHSVADVFGGGLELRPWEATSDRAVYDHYRGRWIAPRRWVPYDGAPSDFALSLALAAPLLAVVGGDLRLVVLGALVVGAGYAALRRSLPALAEVLLVESLLTVLPERASARIPPRYVEAGIGQPESSRGPDPGRSD